MAAIPVKRNFYRAGLEGNIILPEQAGFKDASKFGAEEDALYKEADCKYGDITGMLVHQLKKNGHKVTVTDEVPKSLGEALPWPGNKK
mmetsp:Transcript_59468/g.163129  ORF Transcript_59468/g.163129 Transcript_59468/m.163129 type:complete len:88 (+) Transcript_59468:113-376(+)